MTRSAIAPEMSAAEMTANVIWKPAATRNGTPELASRESASEPCRPKKSAGLPKTPPTSLPKATE